MCNDVYVALASDLEAEERSSAKRHQPPRTWLTYSLYYYAGLIRLQRRSRRSAGMLYIYIWWYMRKCVKKERKKEMRSFDMRAVNCYLDDLNNLLCELANIGIVVVMVMQGKENNHGDGTFLFINALVLNK